MQVVRTGDYPVIWISSVHSIGLGSQVYGSFLGELPTSHEDMVDDEHIFSSPNERSVKEDHPDVRGHATGMRYLSQW